MPKVDLPHVLHTFETLDDRGRRILNVADLPIGPNSVGFDAEALDALTRQARKLIDPHNGYDEIKFHSES